MATTYTGQEDLPFNDMLKVFMPFDLLNEEMKKRNYFWNKVPKDENWFGGSMQVPFEGGEYSSLSFGNLTASDDIAEGKYVLGTVTNYRELWGTMIFYEKDLDLHGNMQASFLSILPGKLNQFLSRMAERVSHTLLNGAWIDTFTADGGDAGTGIINVNHPERFTIGEKVYIDDDDSTAGYSYVISIDMNAKTITVSTARGGAASNTVTGSDGALTDMTTAQNAKLYTPGAQPGTAVAFTSLRSQLLSSTNGGDATIFGETKTTYPYLQAQNIDGSAITAANILDSLFDAYYEVVTLGKGNPTEMIMHLSHFAECAKTLEVNKRYTKGDTSGGYGWRKLSVLGPEGELTLTGIRDIDTDVILVMDWSALKFYGSHFFDRKRHGGNEEYFMSRAASGYTYIVDIRLFGELVVHAPSHCGIIHTISY